MNILPLGIRTNNPMNVGPVALPDVWDGQTGIRPEDGCCAFDTAPHGIRAGSKNLHGYAKNQGINTIKAMSAQWAPANATNVVAGRPNDPLEHAAAVAQESGYDMATVLDFTDETVNARVCMGIIFAEEGHRLPGIPWFTMLDIRQAQALTGLWG
jgi:hypothetical protein